MKRLLITLVSIFIFFSAPELFSSDCGDINRDGSIDVSDIVFLINYKYRGGPAPDLTEAADVNSDGHIDILDIIDIIEYKYKDGPEPICGKVMDIDGNVYKTIFIGNQMWMAENLKVTHYRNGDLIPEVIYSGEWWALLTGAYCTWNNVYHWSNIYGRFYNWYTVNDSRNLAPEGWHLPTDEEWQELIDYLGGDAVAGGKMKETEDWWYNLTNATNESGFSARGGGCRSCAQYGDFKYYRVDAFFWSLNEDGNDRAWSRVLYGSMTDVHRIAYKKFCGLSIRCVKDASDVRPPILTTTGVSDITETTVKCGGTITSNGGPSVTARGVCWSTDPIFSVDDNKTIDGAGVGNFISSVTDLTANTKYYMKAYATNFMGTSYGETIIFNTTKTLPILTTAVVAYIELTTAKSGGYITSDGGEQVTARGICWGTSPLPTIADDKVVSGSGIGVFSSLMTDLTPDTSYYVRAYATSSIGTAYGNQYKFSSNTLFDIEGNSYQTVRIGTQVWMAENLKTTYYSNGEPILGIGNRYDWEMMQYQPKAAYCNYDNNANNVATYGRLYTRRAAHSVKKIAPKGWHLPSEYEWRQLEKYLGVSQDVLDSLSIFFCGELGTDEGGKLKEIGTDHWTTPNAGATDEIGFSARPGGYRDWYGDFLDMGDYAYFWNSTVIDFMWGGSRKLSYGNARIYHCEAYESKGLSIRCVKDFDPPVLITNPVSAITTTTAECGGNISDDDGGDVYARGVCWSTDPTPTVANKKTADGMGIGSFSSSITGLTAGINYYVRAYATNSMGTSYGAILSFKTLPILPALTTASATVLSENTAECGGTITADGGAVITARGVCWSIAPMPTVDDNKSTDGTGVGSFTSSISGLIKSTTYHVRAYATNSVGTAYGEEVSFLTFPIQPIISTAPVVIITETMAKSGGNIIFDGGATITDRGVCWSINPTPTVADNKTSDGVGSGSFTSSITGLTAGTFYYIRAYAINNIGLTYGNQYLYSSNTVTDIDGNVYEMVTIGSQVWLTRNLNVTRYSNGDTIPNVTNNSEWEALTTGAYISCNQDNANDSVYGLLYNWYAVNDDRNIAPEGWHVPTDPDWRHLEMDLGMSEEEALGYDWRGTDEGGKIKESGTTHWASPNAGATNESGFTALPGGAHGFARSFRTSAYFWTSNRWDNITGLGRRLYNNYSSIWRRYFQKFKGLSVRCVKDVSVPLITTSDVSDISKTSAKCGGTITSDGGAFITANGVCWSIYPAPTVADNMIIDSSGAVDFKITITDLTGNTSYYVRAFATNRAGTGYGDVLSFTSSPILPVLTTEDISAITETTAECGGTITSDGGATVIARGVCWSIDPTPTTADYKTVDGTGTGGFASSLIGLTKSTVYYIRAYATNTAGTAYGEVKSFTTIPVVPILTTADISDITETTAECGGTITYDAGGTITARGVCWSTNPLPTVADNKTTDGTGSGSFTSSLTDLTASTIYYTRAYATIGAGTGYGEIVQFSTFPVLPVLTTAAVNIITETTAICGGTITFDGNAEVTARGICWSTDPEPTTADNKTIDGAGTGGFISSIIGLEINSFYYVRAYATNSLGTGYGNQYLFSTNTITDIDGNVYEIITIGTQIWMADNLKVTRYRNGDTIPNVPEGEVWSGLSSGGYCNYYDDEEMIAVYGRLYNGYSVNDSRNIAPEGWHVPTDEEWKQMEIYLGMSQAEADATGWRGTDEGGKLKETGTAHWGSPNAGATNESRFTALPGGYRFINGVFMNFGFRSGFWSSAENKGSNEWHRILDHNYSQIYHYYYDQRYGFSVRCVKD